MRTTLSVVAPPTLEPVSTALANKHCRIDGVADDDLVGMYITTARMLAEAFLGRALITQTLLWTIQPDPPPYGALASGGPWWTVWRGQIARPLELPRAPVASISSVTLTDRDFTTVTIPPTVYQADLALQPALLRLNLSQVTDPIAQPIENVKVQFIAGYGPKGSDVPAAILNAILLTVASLYEHRGDDAFDLPKAAEALLFPFRIHHFGA
jgi:uncharacterized phiE125 gp8 family phage protein